MDTFLKNITLISFLLFAVMVISQPYVYASTYIAPSVPQTNVQSTNTVAPQNSGVVSFVSLSGVEELSKSGQGGLASYVNIAFTILITVSAMLAVIFIALAGVKYMTVDMMATKEAAKDDIYSSLIGLLIILASVVILNTINPCITSFHLLDSGGTSCSVHK